MKISRALLLSSALLTTLGTLAVGYLGIEATSQASLDSAKAQANYLNFSSQLADLEAEQQRTQKRLREIPVESTEAWRLCAHGIVNDAFNTPKSAAEEFACDEHIELGGELGRLEVRESRLPTEIQSARNQKKDWQVQALAAEQNFTTTITFWVVGTALIAATSVVLWVLFARSKLRKGIQAIETDL